LKHRLILASAALLGALALPALATDPHANHKNHMPSAKDTKAGTAKVRFDDSVLVDQAGKSMKLKSEVMADRIVVLDFVYTTCTTICPVLTATMVRVQNELDAKARDDVRLITITVDPARDTPARMKEYGDKMGVKPGWIWLTGPTGRVNEVLKGFGAYAPSFEDHPPLILVGDASTGQWTRFFGFADPKDVIARVNELRAARGAAAHAGHKH
jgi:protein SCO1